MVFLCLCMGKWQMVRIWVANGKNSHDFFSFFLYKLWGGGSKITKAFQFLGDKDTVQLLILTSDQVEIVF